MSESVQIPFLSQLNQNGQTLRVVDLFLMLFLWFLGECIIYISDIKEGDINALIYDI